MIWSILNFISALGKTSIEVHEWSEYDVRKTRLPKSPNFSNFTKRHPDLTFSGWELAHAVVKADYLDRRNLTMPGLGFLLQADNLISFSKSPIELKDGTSKALNDFSLTSLSGRVGQGLAILFGHRLGLQFTAHLHSYYGDSLAAGIVATTHKGVTMADFLFADNNKTVLIESKGTFTLQQNDPTRIKSVLKSALTKQVDPWMGHIQPTPSNGYVVYSCLRENSWAPSGLSFVDPNGEDGKSADVPFSIERVMRENYGAWLHAMGLPKAAKRLRRSPGASVEEDVERQSVETRFLVYEYGERSFAVPAKPYGWPQYDLCGLPVAGVDLDVLKAISNGIENPDLALTDLLSKLPPQADARQETISIFPDGSVVGLLKENYVSDVVEVRL